MIPSYLVIIAGFLCCLFGMIAQTKSIRTALFFLWVALMITSDWIVPSRDQFDAFFVAAIIPAAVIAHIVIRRRLRHTPCIRVNDPYRGYRLVFFLLIFIFSLLIIIFSVSGRFHLSGYTLGILAVFVSWLIFTLSQRPEICGTGVWESGELHTWDEYESYSWTTSDDGAHVELKQKERFREPFGSRLIRLAVPPENSDAAKQLFEANLVNSAGEEAKA